MTLLAQNLSCERNGRLVFSDLNFKVEAGEYAEIRGANGAGKSSLLRLLAGLLTRSSGDMSFSNAADFTSRLHFIAHQDAMKPALTLFENLEFWCRVLGGTGIDAALDAFQLKALQHEPVQLLSAGQRRRLTLSRLFLAERPIWLLDEPMTALDAGSQKVLRDHMRNFLKSGGIILAATHGDLGLEPDHIIGLSKA